MRLLLMLGSVVILLASCGDEPVCAPAPVSMEIEPIPLSTEDSVDWILGPYTQGSLHFTVSHESPLFVVTLFNRQQDSVVLDLTAQLHQTDELESPIPVSLQWNTDAGLLTIYREDKLWLQRVLPFYDDLGIHSMKTRLMNVRLDSLSKASLIQDPPDIKIAYWGNTLSPERAPLANRPWDAQLAEMTHSQGVFLRINGTISGGGETVARPIGLLKSELEKLLSRRPDFVIVSAGEIAESTGGGGYLPTFRQEMTEMLTMIGAAGSQAILLTMPPVREGSALKRKDLRGAYNMELRTLAVNHGASVVDLADRFRDEAHADKELLIDLPTLHLSQYGHDVLAAELSTLLQYYLQFSQGR